MKSQAVAIRAEEVDAEAVAIKDLPWHSDETFQELEESDIDVLAARCKAAGLEHLFRTALKLAWKQIFSRTDLLWNKVVFCNTAPSQSVTVQQEGEILLMKVLACPLTCLQLHAWLLLNAVNSNLHAWMVWDEFVSSVHLSKTLK